MDAFDETFVEQGKYHWNQMSRFKLGRYAEHLVCLELLALNFDIYTVDVDDHGVDLVARRQNGPFFDFQIRANRNMNYIFFRKSIFSPRDNLYAVIVPFFEGEAPEIYLIPSIAWLHPTALLVDRNYEQTKSKPEWGLNFSQQNLALLKPYLFSKIIQRLL